jgi:hypothetical protein
MFTTVCVYVSMCTYSLEVYDGNTHLKQAQGADHGQQYALCDGW